MIQNTRPAFSFGLVSSLYRLATPGEWIDQQEAERRVRKSLRRLAETHGAPKVVRDIGAHPCRSGDEAVAKTVLLLKVPTR